MNADPEKGSELERSRQLARQYSKVKSRPVVDDGLTPVSVDGDTWLVLSLGRKPTRKESRVFWDEIARLEHSR